MQPRPSQRAPVRRILAMLALCGLIAGSGNAFARGGAGNAGGGSAGAGSGMNSSGSQNSRPGQSSDTLLNGHDAAPAPVPIKLQKLLERHHLTRSRVLDAEIDRKGALWIYELKLLGPDGVVRERRYNALNGDALPHNHD
ncbi:MAG: hypothetical protein P8Z69_04085 [Acidihalobacter sp.]